MEEQPSPPASSGDNFTSFFNNPSSFQTPPLQSASSFPPSVPPLSVPHSPISATTPPLASLSPARSPRYKSAPFEAEATFLTEDGKPSPTTPAPSSPTTMSRSVSLSALIPQKPSFMGSFAQISSPWGLFQSGEEGEQTTTVRHPLMGHRPQTSDSEEEIDPSASAQQHPTASASSTSKAASRSPEDVSSAKPVADPSLLPFSNLSIYQVSTGIISLRKLARQGAWRALVEKVKDAKKRGQLALPDEEVTYGTYHLLALMKLRSYGAASDELAALGDLDSPHYRYEHHPSLYPDKSGSMVPFALRWMHADLPHRMGQTSATLDRLYALLAHCNSRIDALQAAPTASLSPPTALETAIIDDPGSSTPLPTEDKDVHMTTLEASNELVPDTPADRKAVEAGSSPEDDDFGDFVASTTVPVEQTEAQPLRSWLNRRDEVLYALVSHHLNQKQFVVALQWLNWLLTTSPSDADLLSKVGYVQLQMGDLPGARHTFSVVESILLSPSDSHLVNLVGRNRGLLHFAEKQYSKAIQEFDAVLKRDPHDTVSANNKALCLMYSRELVGATQVLEELLQTNPLSTLNETVVLNLCSMYELASMNSVDSKRTLSTWLMNHAPDDFDLSCTRL